MKCPNCHIENPENQKYCGDCGTLLIDTIINDKIFENKIESIIQKQLKDKQVVEIEITENIASKIANWAKLFAYFIGIPFAIIIFILGFLGYNSYSSFTKLIEDNEKKIRPQIELAKVRVDSLNMEAVALKINLEKYKELNKQVSDLTKTVNIIAEKFNIKGVSENKKKQIESSLNSFQDYIKNLGYNPIGKEVNVSIESMSSMGTAFYYDGNSNTMHIDSAYADDYDLFFREYMHRVLYANIDQNNLPSPNEERWYFSIESGLANYYACSHNNNPIFAHTSAKKGNDFKIDFSKKTIFHKPKDMQDAMYSVANSWSGAFWKIRQNVGQKLTDKLLFTTWKSLSIDLWMKDNPMDFVNLLIITDKKLNEGKNVNTIKEIFSDFGLK